MNFLDTYDVASDSTPTQRPEQSLNDEVSEVIGQLGRFWGGFRKQSQSVLQTARKDLGDVVTQAHREITKLTSEPAASASTPGMALPEGDTSSPDRVETDGVSRPSASIHEGAPAPSTSTMASTSLFSRLQSALPPNLLETARNQLPESLKHASENIDLPQLRANFVSEFQRVQGVTRAQAEEYAHKSEVLLREAVKEAGEVLRDAVKILPPEEPETAGVSGLVWDGSDMWALPLEPSDLASSSNPPTSQSSLQRRYNDAQDVVATRAQSLFKRLKNDPAIVRHDPAVDGGELYSAWVAAEVTSKEGGIEGEQWSGKISALLVEPGSGEVLKTTRDVLVPSELTEVEFWTRFFFRAHQIEAEETKRKALLEGILEEEDFSWEDEDEETGVVDSPATLASVAGTGAPDPPTNERRAEVGDVNGNLPATPSTVARDSSEDYDVVSSGNVSPRAEHKPVTLSNETKDEASDADSDWE